MCIVVNDHLSLNLLFHLEIHFPGSDSLPIDLQKGTRTCTSHTTSQFEMYVHLFPSLRVFISFMSSMSSMVIPTSIEEALSILVLRQAMEEEM